MRIRWVVMLCVLSMLLGVAFAQVETLIDVFAPDVDWYSKMEAERATVPDDLDSWEEELYRAGYANGHYDSRHPEYIEGVYVLNTDSKKFHITSCQATVTLSTKYREHLIGTREDALARGYVPCKMCNP